MKVTNKVVIWILILSVLLGLTGCGNKAANTAQGGKKTIKIAYLPLTHALPLFVEAQDANIHEVKLRDVNIELVKFGSWSELADALNSGKVDGASILIELGMRAKEQGIKLKAVALGHRDGNNVTVAEDIYTVADLKGKTIAIPQRFSSQNILLYQMLKNAGLDYQDVQVVELTPAEMPAALAQGHISGYIVAEPFGAKSVVSGKGKILFQSQDLWPDSICCGLVLREDFIKNNSEAVKELVDGYVAAGKEAEEKDDKVQKMALKYMPVKPNVLDLSLKFTSYTNLKIDEKDYEQLSSYLLALGLTKNPPKYSDFVDNSFIDKAE